MENKFYKKVLKNGMTILFEKRNVPVVSVAFAVKQGGVNESAEEKGISHFIEHLLYKGTSKRNARQIAEEIERKGGELNGFTTESATAFWCKMPSKHLNIALEVLGDMVKNPLFDKKEIEKERQVIFEEIKLYKDNPRLHIFDEMHKSLYEEPFGIPLIGTEKTLLSLSRDKIIKKFKKVYKSNNMILCVVGDANFEEIVAFTEKNFGSDKGEIKKIPVAKINKQKIEKRQGIDQANLIFAYHVPDAKDKKSYAAFVLNVLLAGGMSSRLFSEIREKRNLAYAVKGHSDINKDFAYNYVYVGTKKENVEKVRALILKEFEKITKALDKGELERVKKQIIGNYLISMEDSQHQMANLLSYEINGDAKELYEFEENINSVKERDIKEIAKKAIKKYSFYALVPK